MSVSDSLRYADLAGEYRSDRGSVVDEFYVPALSVSRSYDRAVGYFTSSVLAVIGAGVDEFVRRGGVMRIIASPYLLPEDVAEIEAGYELRSVLEKAAIRDLERAIEDSRAARGLGKLGNLVAEGRLDFKLAYVTSGNRVGMYHEKIGVFRDDRDLVAFKGSANETLSGLIGNFESIEVFRSWDERGRERALRISRHFDDLWADRTTTLRVIPFTDAAKKIVERSHQMAAELGDSELVDYNGAPVTITSESKVGILTIPAELQVREYQKQAVGRWFAMSGRGILRMATGTGKTLTALSAGAQVAKMLHKTGEPLLTVVVAPYQHLVDQWAKDIEWFGVSPVRAYESTASWFGRASHLLDSLALGTSQGGVVITTNKTFGDTAFQNILSRYSGRLLLIADEAHNLGAKHISSKLPENAEFRLGLSATPERWFDDEGTAALTDYFGDVVFEMGIGEAIKAGALCRYTYTPVIVELDAEETELYVEITEKIARIFAAQQGSERADEDSALGALLRKRSNLLGHARAKLPALRKEIEKRRGDWHQLLYCAEGRHPLSYEAGAPEEPAQIDQALDLVGNQLQMPAARYTAETKRVERRQVLERFANNKLQVVASMRCLDEGVDVPAARTAYLLASSTNPRQFIQRRGRVLRQSPGKSVADIVDFIVVPPEDVAEMRDNTERGMVARELARVTEFAHLAENEAETLDILRPLRIRYGLLDI
ncbi:DNA phosphorothioation system restriction enzyme [Streptomyces sp. TRM66268-LWL]|uniref:DNA phosphorothioation system restriction enzyme n=2 Tax=Streptomyces polyasparticus TaxID=2767826 RepID=A0ABR7SQR3_9ACTN|nr:DNA phosphorothioation system restriction enzyme [Streptomyces polyasparticus]MBC9717840.1 DNA phosphorothioation system restriction enzyme [Streptomyces polyasparticus]